MNVSDFRTKYPEFNTQQNDAFLEAYLEEAAREISVEVAGARFDDLHGALTAHLLAISPHGKQARLAAPMNGKTTYWDRYQHMLFQVTCGLARCP